MSAITTGTDCPVWPLPESVGQWGTAAQFQAQRPESGQWVFWEDRVDQVLAGRYNDVLPLHVELSPTFLCNFSCPWCSCRSARSEWSETDVFTHPRSTPATVMRTPGLTKVIDHLAEHQVEIMWVGGEPTMNPLLYPAAATYAHARGLQQCIFTNGSLFTSAHAATLFNAQLVFIRVSLNSVTPQVHQRQHDYDPRRPHGQRVLDNLTMLAALRAQHRDADTSPTKLGVSVVVDTTNIADLNATLTFTASLADTGAVDYVIVRPVFPLVGAKVDVDDETRAQFHRVMAPDSPARRLLSEAGVHVVTPQSSVSASTTLPDDDHGCLAAGWFGEITPSGAMLPCSDLYGDPDYTIGNLTTQTLGDIWSGSQRQDVLTRVGERRCASQRCPSNGRGHHLNRVFRDVERHRNDRRMSIVADWITHLRAVLPRPTHSFFL